jgi:hypothetical protein
MNCNWQTVKEGFRKFAIEWQLCVAQRRALRFNTPMADDETIALRVAVIGGKRHADDFEVIWRDLTIGRIMKRDGIPAQADQWWWGFSFYRRPSLDGDMSGTGSDLDGCKTKFKAAWASIRAGLTDEDIARARAYAEIDVPVRPV